jgi:Ca-activated chloride channel homolog
MSNQTTTRAGMLAAKGSSSAPVPLVGVSIDAEIRSVYARVVVAQRYVNRESNPIEAVYVFPLDDGAAVCGFEAIVDGTLVIGEVHEREKAFELYDDAMEQGHGAFLLDEERPDVFQASIGNLPPGKEVLVKLTYVTELTVNDRRLRFSIPTTVSPRYAPAEDHSGMGRPDAETLNPPVEWTVPYGLNLSVHVSMPGRISGIESPSHPIAMTLDDCRATVTLAQQDAALDRDFVLSVEAIGLDAPSAVVERDEEGAEVVAVTFSPAFEVSSIPAELIFVVDQSGSMEGSSIAEVRNALQLCLRSMIPGCSFNIVGFGSTHNALFAKSRDYNQKNLEIASAHVAEMKADLGGTEILPALQFVLKGSADANLPRQVVILTDGEVTNTDAVIALAAEHAADARVFTFGIGRGASQHLVRGLARAGGGSSEFIYPGERIEPKVLRQFARLLSPAINDVRVEWSGGSVTQAPADVPAVFAGGRLMIYGFVKGGRPTRARLIGTGRSGALSFDVPIDGTATAPGRIVATLAARARIRELEERGDWAPGRGSQQRERKSNAARSEMIALSTRYCLISRETSFVAVERRDSAVTGEVMLRRVPVALTSGWGALQESAHLGLRYGSADAVSALAPPMAPGAMPDSVRPTASRLSLGGVFRGFKRKPEDGPIERAAGGVRADAILAPPNRTRIPRSSLSPGGMVPLIMLQAADGSWELTPELASLLGRDVGQVRAAVAATNGARDAVTRAWATALALAWLQQHAARVEDEWRLVAEKARTWLRAASVVPATGGTWEDAARAWL